MLRPQLGTRHQKNGKLRGKLAGSMSQLDIRPEHPPAPHRVSSTLLPQEQCCSFLLLLLLIALICTIFMLWKYAQMPNQTCYHAMFPSGIMPVCFITYECESRGVLKLDDSEYTTVRQMLCKTVQNSFCSSFFVFFCFWTWMFLSDATDKKDGEHWILLNFCSGCFFMFQKQITSVPKLL